MKRSVLQLNSSLYSCEKDAEIILKKLFVESKQYSEQLIRLLVLNTKDCLDNYESKVYQDTVNSYSLSKLVKEGYIRLEPRLLMPEFEEVRSYIIITFDGFKNSSASPKFKDSIIQFDIICNFDEWELGDYRLRPIKIAGIIEGILHDARLSGMGQLEFIGCDKMLISNDLGGYSVSFRVVHGSEDNFE